MEYVIAGLVVIVLIIEVYKLTVKPVNNNQEIKDTLKEENHHLMNTMIKENGELRLELANTIGKSSKENIKDLNTFKDGLTEDIMKRFEALNNSIENQMEGINKKVEYRLNEGFEKTNKTFTNIVERLTKIDEAQKNIDKLSSEVVSLQNILTDKKTRGTFGEVQLNHILESIFGEGNKHIFDTQVTLSNGKVVDALIHLPEEMGDLAIDSKFPLENYTRMVDKDITDRDRELATREFKRDMKKHIDDISSKYILPTETSEQAVMFVPAEAIFAEINAYHQDIIEYAQRNKVWIASPTTLMSLLTTVQLILRNVERDKHAKVIQEELLKLGDEFKRYQARWDKLSRNIDTVSKSVKEIHTTSNKIGKKFDRISNVNIETKEEIELK